MAKIEKIGRVTSQSVLKGTGKSWDQWMQILEKAGAKSWSRKEIVAYLKTKHKLSSWWQQGVTHGFEVQSGRRIDGQNSRGLYSVTITRSIATSVKKIWPVVVSEEGLTAWLSPMSPLDIEPKNEFEVEGGIHGEVRTVAKARRVRLAWHDSDWPKPTVVQLTLVNLKKKSIVVIQHDGLPNPRAKEKMRGYWKEKVDAFVNVLKTLSSD